MSETSDSVSDGSGRTASAVVDFFPRGTPLIVAESMRQAMEEALADGASARETYEAMEDEQVRLLRTDESYRSQLRQAYREAGVNVVNATMMSFTEHQSYAEGVRADVVRWQARFDAVDWLEKVTGPAEVHDIVAGDDVGVILNTQNYGAAIEGDLGAVEPLYNAGIRCAQLTYNSQNLIGTGCTERVDAGLSHHGVEAVRALNDRNMIVDLSHCGRATTLDAITVSDAPVAFTHVFCGALADHDRAKSDEELRELAKVDGYAGILAVPFFLEPGVAEPSFETVFDHVDHAIDILGIDRVGIGTDWGSWTPELPEELHEGFMEAFAEMGFREEHGVTIGDGYGPMQRYDDWGVIPQGLEERGYTRDERRKILGENFIDFWSRVQSS